MTSRVKIFSGRSSRYLAEKIAKSFGRDLGKSVVTDFSDGEFQPSFEENVRGSDVFIVQSTFAPTDNLFELLMMIDAFIGPRWRSLYETALADDYRFLSFGDAMLLDRHAD